MKVLVKTNYGSELLTYIQKTCVCLWLCLSYGFSQLKSLVGCMQTKIALAIVMSGSAIIACNLHFILPSFPLKSHINERLCSIGVGIEHLIWLCVLYIHSTSLLMWDQSWVPLLYKTLHRLGCRSLSYWIYLCYHNHSCTRNSSHCSINILSLLLPFPFMVCRWGLKTSIAYRKTLIWWFLTLCCVSAP